MIRKLKKRYIGFKLASERVYSRREVSTLILNELYETKSNHEKMIRIRLLDYNVEKGIGVLLCDHKSIEKIHSAFNKIQDKSQGETTIQMIGVSGTIKALKRKFFSKMA